MGMQFLFLGTGGSAGTPLIGCNCEVCTSKDPCDQRLRPSGLLKIGEKTFLIDTTPDLRQQALKYKITHLDGILLTHTHYDHIGGLDELRTFYLIHRKRFPVLVSESTLSDLQKRYYYLFQEKSMGVSLSAQLDFHVLKGKRGQVTFEGVTFHYTTFEQGGMEVTGYRVGSFAYISDIRHYPETIFEDLDGISDLVISAVGHKPSDMHLTIPEAIAFSQKIGAKRTWFTHLSHRVSHEKTNRELPSGFQLAHDGLTLNIEG